MFNEYVVWLILIHIIYIFVKLVALAPSSFNHLGFRDNFIVFSLGIVTDVCMRD